jgi:phosphoserine phosphatase RsbU/P
MVLTQMRKKKALSPNLFRALLGLFILASLSYWVAYVMDAWEMNQHWDRHVNLSLDFDNNTHVITRTESAAKKAGLTVGDTVTGLNGAPYSGTSQWTEIAMTARPGDTLDVEYTRQNGSKGMATITLPQAARSHPEVQLWLVMTRSLVVYDLFPLISLLVGYWIVLAKPQEKNAWLILLILTLPSCLNESGFAYGTALLVRAFWYEAIQLLAPAALLLFGIYFPERSRIDRKVPWLKWVVILPILLFAGIVYPALYKEYFLGGNFTANASPVWGRIVGNANAVVNFLDLACVLLYLLITLDKLRSASTEDARRRLRVLTVGMTIGVGSLLTIFVLLPHFGISYSGDSTSAFWLAFLGMLLFMTAPFTLAYVVLVQRAMDVRVILRMGTRYLMAKAFLVVLQFVLVAFALWHLVLPALNKRQPQPSDIIGTIVFLALVLALRVGIRTQLQTWLDRKFFREAYNAEVVLNELSDEVRRFTETTPLLETVCRRVAETLHVDQIAVLLRHGESFHLQQAIGMDTYGPLMLPAQASAVRYLSSTNEPARLYRDDPDAWYLMAGTGERQVLDQVNAELLLPLAGRNRLMGMMVLGPKRSEAAYTQADLHLLQTVATQTGLAIEVAELAHSLAREAAQRERVNREIEIAREVQERLFPQDMPALAGATIAGSCRPALGVGGDYYDVFELSDGRTGVAIGDVSGKGIAAALLMASLRASLRGVSLDNPRDFANLMDKVNRLVYEASASNRYATFFFAAYDPATRKLDCVNAGHNPPIILRTGLDGKVEAIRLEADGPVVGLLPFAPYTEQSITLQPGDMLLLYTDGISEAMTHDDEEWGEERMIAAAELSKNKNADVILQDIFRATDAFTAGAPQHDDMTLLILKLEE